MPIDISAMSPQAREHYLAIGLRYPTSNVLAQGDKTLQGLGKHAALLVAFGFALRDGTRLGMVCDQVRESVVGRSQAQGSRKLTSKRYRTACRKGRLERKSAISALSAAVADLLEAGNEQATQMVQTTLDQTSRLASNADLPRQLQLLLDILEHPAVAEATADRGGPDIVTRIRNARAEILESARERTGQTPVSAAAEERDILEGIVVSLARSAAAAANVASRTLGQPSIALDFKLTYLDGRRTGPDAPEQPGTPEDPGSPEGPETTEPPAQSARTSRTP